MRSSARFFAEVLLASALAGVVSEPVFATEYPSPSTGRITMLPRSPEGKAWELPGRNYEKGTTWFALSCGQERCVLQPATLKTERITKYPYDGDPMPGQRLLWQGAGAASGQNALLTMQADRQLAWLKQGGVSTYYSGTGLVPRAAGPGTMEAQIDLGGQASAVLVPQRIRAKADAGGARSEDKLRLQLRIGSARQVLGEFEFDVLGMRPVPPEEYLLWAGDLDADGKPDFLVSFGMGSYNVALFLSSLAGPGEMVGEAGRFAYFPVEMAGC